MIGVVIGTRPELIKLKPVYEGLTEIFRLTEEIRILYVKQHLAIEDEIKKLDRNYLTFTHVSGPEHIGQTISAMEDIGEHLPDLKLGIVQGDTSTAAGAALAMAYQRIPVVHVEAGLRTVHVLDPSIGRKPPAPSTSPFPEELNRQLISRVASLHLAPTYANEQNLFRERVGGKIVITGNPVIGPLAALLDTYKARVVKVEGAPRKVVVTCHRRENWPLIEYLGHELVELAIKTGVKVFLVVHPNPALREKLSAFENHPHLTLLDPLPHLMMVGMLMSADLVVTDSGGIIEEATYLKKRLVVIRNETERPEASCILTRIPGCAGTLAKALDEPEPSEGSRYAFGGPESAVRCVQEIQDFYWNFIYRHE